MKKFLIITGMTLLALFMGSIGSCSVAVVTLDAICGEESVHAVCMAEKEWISELAGWISLVLIITAIAFWTRKILK
jgi:hypothetical protein